MKNDKTLKFLSVDETIEKAKKEGVDFGTGEPYNRLRYYTKLGWLPHMERKGQNVQGHYPNWVIERLKFIQELKNKGYSNDEITEEINKREKFRTILKPLRNENLKKKLLIGGILALLGF
jgi:DNA-binding transcriptional MerR regulator